MTDLTLHVALLRWFRGEATKDERARLIRARLVRTNRFGHEMATTRGVLLSDEYAGTDQ